MTSKKVNNEEGPWVDPKTVPCVNNGIERAPECKHECQYAKDVSCPEYSCKPACQYLLHDCHKPVRDFWSSENKNLPNVDLPIDSMGDIKVRSAMDLICEKIHEALVLPPQVLVSTPDYGSTGKSIFDSYMKSLVKTKRIGPGWKIQYEGTWKCVDIEVNKRQRTIIKHEHRTDDVGTRATCVRAFWWRGPRRITKKMPARLFKRAIIDLKHDIGNEVADWSTFVQPVDTVRYFTMDLSVSHDGHVYYRSASEIQPPDDQAL